MITILNAVSPIPFLIAYLLPVALLKGCPQTFESVILQTTIPEHYLHSRVCLGRVQYHA